jgi:amidase
MKRSRQILQLCATIILISALLSCGKFSAKTTCNVDPVYYQSASELTSALRRGDITSTKLLDIYLERIKRYNGKINAVVAMDVDAARARATQADKALAQGQIWGPLHGLPMTVKDVYEVVGMPATSGNPALKNHMPKRNAIAVQRLIDAGAIVFGKTNTPFYAMDFQTFNKLYGTTNNPWDLTRTPGGSSGGAAAALAMGFTPLELGSDLGGSLRHPAHFTGVYGHKPTFGIIPRYGHIPPPPGRVPPHIMPMIPLSVVGPMARTAEDLDLAMDVLTTPGKANEGGLRPELLPAPKKSLSDYRVAVWFTDPFPDTEIDAQVMATLRKTVEKLREAGVQIDEKARPLIDLKENRKLFLDIFSKMKAKSMPGAELVAKQKKVQAKWAAFFEDYDVLLAPVTRTVAFPHDQTQPKTSRKYIVNGQEQRYMTNATWALMAVLSGLPVTAAPVGLSDSGLPVGVQIIGARLEDRTTIAFAKGLSKLVGGFETPPAYKN